MTSIAAVKAIATRDELIREFLDASGWGDAELIPLKGDASFRRYIRVKDAARSAMLMDAPPDKENVRPYLSVARFLLARGVSAPEVFADDAERGFVLLEDLGDDLYTRVLAGNSVFSGSISEAELYYAAVDMLAQWHTEGAFHKSRGAVALPDYDHDMLMREVSLLPDWYLPLALGEAKAEALKDEFNALWQELLQEAALPAETFVHRDYHADNLMWLPGRESHARIGLLDFQDAVWGHAAYDLASLLEDARRDVPHALQQELIERYVRAAKADKDEFGRAYAVLSAQRNSKIVGIFVRLARRDGKQGYLSLLPRVWKNLERDLQHPRLAHVRAWTDKHIPEDKRGALTLP